MFEPVACTPESGWEKGQVENQVGNIREWLFTHMAKFEDFAALNAWLATRCLELAGRSHPEQSSRTIAECFAEEQPLLMPVTASFDAYVEEIKRVSQLCLIRIDRNRYSVPAQWANTVACDLTLQTGIISAAIVLNEMRRLTEAAKPKSLTDTPPSTPALTLEPVADCSRYDTLRSACHVH